MARVARIAIAALVERFYAAVDARDYAQARACLADRIAFDYSRLGFGVETDPDAFVAFVRERHAPYARVEHRVSNLVVMVDGDGARGQAGFVASHWAADTEVRIVAGRYDYAFVRKPRGWRIAACIATPR